MERPYDLVLFGATGVTGREMYRHLAAHAPASLRWAIAGRSAARLETLLERHPPQGEAPGIVVADNEDASSVAAMIRGTRVILNAAGPYAVHGETFFRACVEHGTDYVDIGGETFFLQRMIRRYHEEAERNGTKLIPVAGYEALPFDLATLLAVRTLRERHDAACSDVKVIASFRTERSVRGEDGLSGGSVGTMKNLLAFDDVDAFNDPTCLLPESARSDDLRARHALDYLPRFDPDVEAVTGPLFPAPFLNVPVVLRSAWLHEQAGEPYGSSFRYREGTDLRSVTQSRPLQWIGASALGASYFGMSALFRWNLGPARAGLRRLMDVFGPAAGEGPSEAAMAGMDYRLDVFAVSPTGDPVRGSVTGRGHPGYRSTAAMSAEAALALAIDREKLPAFTGIVTPATGLGLGIRDRLKTAGIELAIE